MPDKERTELEQTANGPDSGEERSPAGAQTPGPQPQETQRPPAGVDTAEGRSDSSPARGTQGERERPGRYRPRERSGSEEEGGETGVARPPGRDRFKDGRRGYRPFFKRKVCKFCTKKLPIIYRDADALRRFITERGKILPRRITGTCPKHQRRLAKAIKQARVLALLPFVEK